MRAAPLCWREHAGPDYITFDAALNWRFRGRGVCFRPLGLWTLAVQGLPGLGGTHDIRLASGEWATTTQVCKLGPEKRRSFAEEQAVTVLRGLSGLAYGRPSPWARGWFDMGFPEAPSRTSHLPEAKRLPGYIPYEDSVR